MLSKCDLYYCYYIVIYIVIDHTCGDSPHTEGLLSKEEKGVVRDKRVTSSTCTQTSLSLLLHPGTVRAADQLSANMRPGCPRKSQKTGILNWGWGCRPCCKKMPRALANCGKVLSHSPHCGPQVTVSAGTLGSSRLVTMQQDEHRLGVSLAQL